ncbi:hypothetical protein ACVIW2_008149 [Bradyrhizobium huanghuaihaiense]
MGYRVRFRRVCADRPVCSASRIWAAKMPVLSIARNATNILIDLYLISFQPHEGTTAIAVRAMWQLEGCAVLRAFLASVA